MGAVNSFHRHTEYIKQLEAEDVFLVCKELRRGRSSFVITEDEFSNLLSSSNLRMPLPPEKAHVLFRDLDDDFDGMLDSLEGYVYVVIWSALPVKDRRRLLLECADFSGNGCVEQLHAFLMVDTIVRVVRKTSALSNHWKRHPAAIKEVIDRMFSKGRGRLTLEDFQSWCEEDPASEELEKFLSSEIADDGVVLPQKEVEFRKALRALEYLFEEDSTRVKEAMEKYSEVMADQPYVSRSEEQQHRFDSLHESTKKVFERLSSTQVMIAEGIRELSTTQQEQSPDCCVLDHHHVDLTRERILHEIDVLQLSLEELHPQVEDLIERLIDATYDSSTGRDAQLHITRRILGGVAKSTASESDQSSVETSGTSGPPSAVAVPSTEGRRTAPLKGSRRTSQYFLQ